jgi:hypothetical protein
METLENSCGLIRLFLDLEAERFAARNQNVAENNFVFLNSGESQSKRACKEIKEKRIFSAFDNERNEKKREREREREGE